MRLLHSIPRNRLETSNVRMEDVRVSMVKSRTFPMRRPDLERTFLPFRKVRRRPYCWMRRMSVGGTRTSFLEIWMDSFRHFSISTGERTLAKPTRKAII